jgi:dTDP-N-acetylfucosamine:lipid II N-acetylfucosaminyltransferase
MNVHIFIDSNGLYVNQTYERAIKISPHDIFIDITDKRPKFTHEKVHYFTSDCVAFFNYIENIDNISVVYFHYYNYLSSYILKKIKKKNPKIKFVWVFWSADFYNLKEFVPELYLSYSQKYLPSKALSALFRDKLSVIKRKIFKQPHYSRTAFIKSIHKIDYIAGLLNKDFENIVNYTKSKPGRIVFAYLPYSELLEEHALSLTATGNKIMVNHSGDPTLNHYEIITLLSEKGVDNTILMMLSYGNPEYINDISTEAKALFPDNLEIITEFIEPSQYPYKLMEVGYAIFNSKIQQGVGNIILLLWLGIKVYLRKENSVYVDFKSWGLLIYSVQDDLPAETFSERMSEAEIRHNREVLQEHLSSEVVEGYYRNLLSIV